MGFFKKLLAKRKLQKRQLIFTQATPPQHLGLRSDIPLLDTVMRLEHALEDNFKDRLKKRVLAKHPNMSSAEYEWHFFELKRFFLMLSLLKQVPMYSDQVDEIWHEMLMFTKDYHNFSLDYVGYMIHHTPYEEPAVASKERAWFNWVYCQLFEVTPVSYLIWNGFFKSPLPQDRLERLRNSSPSELFETDFNLRTANVYTDIQQTISLLIQRLRNQIQEAEQARSQSKEKWAPIRDWQSIYALSTAMLYYSMFDSDHYSSSMNPLLPESVKRSDAAACGFTAVYSGNNDSSGSSNSSCSSSSSCGGSCGGGGCGGGS